MKALQIAAHGNPATVLKLSDIPDVGSPAVNEVVVAVNEVVVAVEASPINGTDLLIMAGRYGYLPKLPSTLGAEGGGRVVAVGSGVKGLKEGDRTVIPFLTPAWAERVKFAATWQRPLPEKADVLQLSMLAINPATAYLLLTDIVQIPRDGWLIHNGANSPTGRAVIATAKSLGIKT
jgi:NADPH:quinone reductase-like Zn-dependent oxidoreductase